MAPRGVLAFAFNRQSEELGESRLSSSSSSSPRSPLPIPFPLSFGRIIQNGFGISPLALPASGNCMAVNRVRLVGRGNIGSFHSRPLPLSTICSTPMLIYSEKEQKKTLCKFQKGKGLKVENILEAL